MPITKLTEGKYAGKSTDIKPAAAKIGATFYEYDTEILYDKTVNHPFDNGWKLRESGGSGSSSNTANTVKSGMTVKIKNGVKYMVIMAGQDDVNFQEGDIVLGRGATGNLVIGTVPSGPFNTISDLDVAIDGFSIN